MAAASPAENVRTMTDFHGVFPYLVSPQAALSAEERKIVEGILADVARLEMP